MKLQVRNLSQNRKKVMNEASFFCWRGIFVRLLYAFKISFLKIQPYLLLEFKNESDSALNMYNVKTNNFAKTFQKIDILFKKKHRIYTGFLDV